jgi:uncharacterized protein YqeY
MIPMDTKKKLEDALKDAMRSHDELRKRTVRMALSAIHLTEIDQGKDLDENMVLGVLQKEVKSRLESIADAQRANRTDLVEVNQAELALLEQFLPQPFSQAELEAIAKQAIAESGATSLKEMGQVMKLLIPRLSGRATGDQASQVVRQLLG